MSKLLPTRLPQATGESVSASTFNRLVRVLELNLGAQDPDNVQHFSADDLTELQFKSGAIIFRDLYSHQTYPSGVEVSSAIGAVTIEIT